MIKLPLAGLLVCSLATAGTTTVTIPPTRDTAIYSENNNANGAGPSLFLGRTRTGSERRTLIAFDDLSQIPSGALIQSVELQIRVTRGKAGALSVSIHEMAADWGEGISLAGGNGGQGGAPSNGGATWNNALFPDTAWQQSGGDFAAAQLATQTVPASGSVTFASTPALVASVQAWLDDAAPNRGWMLRAAGALAESAKRLGSREGSAGNRPTLIVAYQDPEPVTLSSLTISGPVMVGENSSADYMASALFSDDTVLDVTDAASWSQDSPFASINANGVLTTLSVSADELVSISASYASDGAERSDSYDVIIRDEPLEINYGLAGGWFNPLTAGQGFLFDFLLDSQFMFVAAFTFDAPGGAKGGGIDGSEQRWFTAQGGYSGSRADLTIFQTLGGVFNNPTTPITTPVGTMEVEFATCTDATITYDLPDFGLAGVIPVTKLLADEICSRISSGEIDIKQHQEAAPSGVAQAVNYGLIGGWFDPATAGQGFLFDFLLESRFMFVAWFTFDSAGAVRKGGAIPGEELRWFTAQGNYTDTRADLTLFATRNGVFDDPTVPTTDAVGTMGIEFADCTHATISYELPGFGLTGTIAATKLLADEICTRINEGEIELSR